MSVYSMNMPCNDPMICISPSTILAAADAGLAGRANNLAGFATAGIPGFSPPEPGTLAVYRRISSHPTVALVMRMVTAPIVANSWDWRTRPGTPAEWTEFVRGMLQPMRTRVMTDALRAMEFGFAGFEKVWLAQGDRMVLKKLKPLLPELTQVLVDSNGNLKGLQNQVPGGQPKVIPQAKSFLYSYDCECGNYYGRSRHENVRSIWSQALQTTERLAQYHKKVAGVIAQLHYPEGVSRDAAGVERSNDVIAQQILEAVSMGRSVRFPNLYASIEDPALAADLAGKSQWVLSQFELGGTDYSPGLLNALAHYDKALFRGWLRPERVGLDSQHGTRADAQQHSESAIVDSELVDRDFAAAFNSQVVDEVLAVNFGEAARGAVWVDPSPISDAKTETVKAVLTALLGNSQTAPAVSARIDVPALLADLDVPGK